MSFIFGGNDTPSAPTPPPPPNTDSSAQAARDAAARDEMLRRQATGRASTILTSGAGDLSTAPTASKVLTGS